MGVPKFFRYISERYPCLSELIKENQIAEFDNLYLDMNGIIHNCSHPDDGNVQFRITEEQIFIEIFHYIEILFTIIKPHKLFFLAIDGVAPRAKMNQQRGRRFRSAKDAEDIEKRALDKGIILPTTEKFDSNCITPGTVFMAKLNEKLKTFIQNKVATNKLWQKCRIIFSGHQVPGEGEHKIMEYIRYMKSDSNYDPTTRHCLYGLDADLILLGLCTHEMNISLLREEVKFGSKAKKVQSVDHIPFYLLHLGLFREYLDLEFISIKDKLSFGYDLTHIIDDFVLMTFMIGNDFMPHLPNLHIHANALPILFRTYMNTLPILDGYLNEHGILNLRRYEVFVNSLAEIDLQLFEEFNANFKYIDSKSNEDTFDINIDEVKYDMDLDLLDLIKNSEESFGSSNIGEEIDERAMVEHEFYLFKRDYYIKKLGYIEMTDEVLAEQTECYITALQWTLYYYYRGIKSWKWFYPHHYAPFVSDIQNFSKLKISFSMGEPFLPFQQLLAVLPPASKVLLPTVYHPLMTDKRSPLIEYYPNNFMTDLNGKKQEWEAVVLVPFIDEVKLLNEMTAYDLLLNPNERIRNIHGPMIQYEFNGVEFEENSNLSTDVASNSSSFVYCNESSIWRHEIDISDDKIVYVALAKDDPLRNIYFPGFPTLNNSSISFTRSIESIGVRVFDSMSRNPNIVLKISSKYDLNTKIEKIAEELIDKEVYVDWPHFCEAKVVALSNEYVYIDNNGITKNDGKFLIQLKQIISHYITRMAIDVGPVNILVHVCLRVNYTYMPSNNNMLVLTKQWSKYTHAYPIQLVVENLNVQCNVKLPHTKALEDIYTKDSTIFMISTIYYGCQGIVLDSSLFRINGRIQVLLVVKEEPILTMAIKTHSETKKSYKNSYAAALAAGITTTVFTRITGTIMIIHGQKRYPLPDDPPRTNIGLQMKFPKKNEEIQGYTKKFHTHYYYSQKAIDVVREYRDVYPKLFLLLDANGGTDIFESDLFSNESDGLGNLSKWLKELPHFQFDRRTCGSDIVDGEVIEMIISAVNIMKNRPHKTSKLQVKPFLLYKPNLLDRQMTPDPYAEYRLFDRVVCVNNSISVPLGLKGTIIGIETIYDQAPIRQSSLKDNNKIYDILFDKPFVNGCTMPGNPVTEKRMYKMSKTNLINISYGTDKFSKKIAAGTTETNLMIPAGILKFKNSDSIGTADNSVKKYDNKSEQLWNMLKTSTDTQKPMTSGIKDSLEKIHNEEITEKSNKNNIENNLVAQDNIKPFSMESSKTRIPNKEFSVVEQQQKPQQQQNQYNKTYNNLDSGGTVYHPNYLANIKSNLRLDDDSLTNSISSDNMADSLREMFRSNTKFDKKQSSTSTTPYDCYPNVDVLNLPKPPFYWRNCSRIGNRNSQPVDRTIDRIQQQITTMPLHSTPILHPLPQSYKGSALQSQLEPPPQLQFTRSNDSIRGVNGRDSSSNNLIGTNIVSNSRHDYSLQSPKANNYNTNNHLNQASTYQMYSQRPKGPKHLTNTSSYSPGKGAFIPLQATKKQYQNKSQSTAQRNLSGVFNAMPPSSQIENTKPFNTSIKETVNRQKFTYGCPPSVNTDVDNANNTTKVKTLPQRPQKPSRLAAKFNNISQKDSN